jgi:hypothetical protein
MCVDQAGQGDHLTTADNLDARSLQILSHRDDLPCAHVNVAALDVS